MPRSSARSLVRCAVRKLARGGDGGETSALNIVPFLDVVMNVMLFLLATIATVFTASVAVTAPGRGPPSPAVERQPLTVQIAPEGYVVGSSRGWLQPDCVHVGAAAVTVPLRRGSHDPTALTRCLDTARNAPALHDELVGQTTIRISVNGRLPYGVLVETLDATRETRAGANDLFLRPELNPAPLENRRFCFRSASPCGARCAREATRLASRAVLAWLAFLRRTCSFQTGRGLGTLD